MPVHVRTQIRNAAVAALIGLPTTADRVYSGRTRPLPKDHLPTLLVYVTEERSDSGAMGGALARAPVLSIEGRMVGADDLEDLLDGIALEVEPAIVARPLLAGLVKEITLTSTRITVVSPGESHSGEIRLEYRLQYWTQEEAPGVAI